MRVFVCTHCCCLPSFIELGNRHSSWLTSATCFLWFFSSNKSKKGHFPFNFSTLICTHFLCVAFRWIIVLKWYTLIYSLYLGPMSFMQLKINSRSFMIILAFRKGIIAPRHYSSMHAWKYFILFQSCVCKGEDWVQKSILEDRQAICNSSVKKKMLCFNSQVLVSIFAKIDSVSDGLLRTLHYSFEHLH